MVRWNSEARSIRLALIISVLVNVITGWFLFTADTSDISGFRSSIDSLTAVNHHLTQEIKQDSVIILALTSTRDQLQSEVWQILEDTTPTHEIKQEVWKYLTEQ